MKKQEAHKRSLEFLDKFISTKSDVLERIIRKHTNTISGPTYAEYLCSLNETYQTVEYIECQSIAGSDWSELMPFDYWQYSPLPDKNELKNKSSKKDSVVTQSLFFCV